MMPVCLNHLYTKTNDNMKYIYIYCPIMNTYHIVLINL